MKPKCRVWLLSSPVICACLPLACAADEEPIPARLDLVAVDQTTESFIFEGVFDVYHLVVGDRLEGVYGLQLELGGSISPPLIWM